MKSHIGKAKSYLWREVMRPHTMAGTAFLALAVTTRALAPVSEVLDDAWSSHFAELFLVGELKSVRKWKTDRQTRYNVYAIATWRSCAVCIEKYYFLCSARVLTVDYSLDLPIDVSLWTNQVQENDVMTLARRGEIKSLLILLLLLFKFLSFTLQPKL